MSSSPSCLTPPGPEQFARNAELNETRLQLIKIMKRLQEEYQKLYNHYLKTEDRIRKRRIQQGLLILLNLDIEAKTLWVAFESNHDTFCDHEKLNAFVSLTSIENFPKERLVQIATQHAYHRSKELERNDPKSSAKQNVILWKHRIRQYRSGDYNFISFSDIKVKNLR